MLVLSRKTGEAIHIGNDIRIVAVECRDGRTRFGIEAPPEVPIVREELLPAGEPAVAGGADAA